MRSSAISLALSCLLTLPGANVLADEPLLQAFADTAGGIHPNWQPTELRGRAPATYELVDLPVGSKLQVTADGAASALVHALEPPVQLRQDNTAQLSWSWKIRNHIAASDITSKAGDDFPARVYVTFARDPRELPVATRMKIRLARMLYGQDVPTAAICYVWARDLPVGTIVPNAYTDTVMMIVVRSGGTEPSAWHTQQRDLQRDYQAAFGAAFGAAVPPVTAVMVAVDSDDTGASARSWFGDLTLIAAQ